MTIIVEQRIGTADIHASVPLHLTRSGVACDAVTMSRLQREFAERQSVLLPRFVSGNLLHELVASAATASFETKTEGTEDDAFGRVEAVRRTDPALFVFHFLLNRPALFRAIECITRCGPIGNFIGRLHRTAGESGHHIDWHGDNFDHRLIGLTLNVSASTHTGGAFQLRDVDSSRIFNAFSNTRPGDAFIFQIGRRYQHRLLPVTTGHRSAGVGWFRSEPAWDAFSRTLFCPVRARVLD